MDETPAVGSVCNRQVQQRLPSVLTAYIAHSVPRRIIKSQHTVVQRVTRISAIASLSPNRVSIAPFRRIQAVFLALSHVFTVRYVAVRQKRRSASKGDRRWDIESKRRGAVAIRQEQEFVREKIGWELKPGGFR